MTVAVAGGGAAAFGDGRDAPDGAPDDAPDGALDGPLRGALDGILVADLSRILAGPSCTMQLADMGARVLKIEPPGGDETRRWGPPFRAGESTYFLSVNRNKESMVLDLRTDGGVDVLHRILERADVLVENFRPGALAKLGFGWDALRERYPRLVYCSVSGYGQTGPRAADPGFDLIAQGEGGLMSITGMPGGPPTKVGTSQADLVAGLLATQGVLLALLARQRSGHGQRVDVALLDGQISLLSYHVSAWLNAGVEPRQLGNCHPTITPYETFAAVDGSLNVGVGTDAMWRAFCAVLGAPDLGADLELATNAGRLAHRDSLTPRLAALLATRTVEEWASRLRAAGIPAGRVQTVPQALADAHVLARDMVVAIDHPTAGAIRLPGIPVKLSATPGTIRTPPPRLGEHTDRILHDTLGLDDGAILALREAGAVA